MDIRIQRAEEEKGSPPLPLRLFKGLLQDFTEFYKLHHSQSLEEQTEN